MGVPKALLDWGGRPLVAWQAEALLEGGAVRVVVVTGHQPDMVSAAVEGLANVEIAHNRNPDAGRASSVNLAARAVAGSSLAIFCNVDQPVESGLIALLLKTARERPSARIICPEVAGRRLHPVLFRADLFGELAMVSEEDAGMRAVLRGHANHLVTVPARREWTPPHFNYRPDYEAARSARFGSG